MRSDLFRFILEMLQILSRVRRWLLDLNLPESGSPEKETVEEERWSTRFYLVAMLTSIVILVAYTALGVRIIIVTVKNPSHAVFKALQEQYPATLKSPCSDISVENQAFFNLEPQFHQVCSSSFVTEDWISASYEVRKSQTGSMDARNVLSAYAQALQILCSRSQVILYDVWKSKLSATLVTADAVPEVYLDQQVTRLVDLIRADAPWQVTLILLIVHMSTASSQVASALGTNAFAYFSMDRNVRLGIQGYQTENSACYCLPLNDCQMQASLYTKSEMMTSLFGIFSTSKNASTPIKGMKTACLPVDGLLSSTLECYSDPSCIQPLVPNSTATPLNRTYPTHFPIVDTTLQEIVDEMLVENWYYTSSWVDYCSACAPEQCSYSYSDHNGILIIFTSATALLGGLNRIWRIIVPLFIRVVARWLKKKRISPDNVNSSELSAIQVRHTFPETLKIQFLALGTKMASYNKFDSHSEQPLQELLERIFTRLDVLLMCVALIVLIPYITFTLNSTMYTVDRPSESIYQELLSKYANSVRCSCRNLAIPQEQFILITWELHQVCQSGFISPSFYLQLSTIEQQTLPHHKLDFMWHSLAYFHWLHNLCSLADLWLTKEYRYFSSKLFVNAQLVTPASFETQTKILLDSFGLETAPAFLLALQQTVTVTITNGFVPVSSTLYDLRVNFSTNDSSDAQVRVLPVDFIGCSCLLQPTECSQPAGFYSYETENDTFNLLWMVPGIRIGCLPL